MTLLKYIFKDQYLEELDRLKQKKHADTEITKIETHYKTMEDNLVDVKEGLWMKYYLIVKRITEFFIDKRSLESRLSTAKRLLKAQEETMKEREEERKRDRAKIITAELDTRGKDSQIRNLNVNLY